MKNKALLIANNGPEISFGGGQRTLMTIKILEAQGYKVEIMLLLNKVWGEYNEENECIKKWKLQYGLVKYFHLSYKNPYLPCYSVVKWLCKVQYKYTKIIFRDETTAFKAGFYFMPNLKTIIDLNDFLLPHLNWFRKLKYYPLHLVLKYNIYQAWVLIEKQKKYFGKKGYCIPNLPLNMFYKTDLHFTKQRSIIPTALFVGSYLGEFIEFLEVADKYIKTMNPFQLFIISRAITDDMKSRFTSSQYVWINNAESIEEYYSKAWISIVPGYKKDGPLIKFIESIYFNTPVVCTTVSLNGYEIFNEKEILIPNSNDVLEFILNMKNILLSEDELDKIASKLKLIANNKFTLNTIIHTLNN